jgi:diguanylate cyclase (GGDEF)-like protein/PAS domain S-box-containing protein
MDAEGRAIAEDNMRRRKEGIAEEQDFRFIRKNGSPLWARVVTNPMTDQHGIYIGTLTMVTDITRRKNVEDALELHDSAITASSNGIVIVDAQREDMPIVTVNPAFEHITGYKASEVVGKPPFMLEGEDRAQRSLSALHLALRQGRDVHVESRNRRKDGVEYWNELFVAPIRNKQGTLTHFVAIQNDITARRNAVEALQRAREELEQKVLERTAELQKTAVNLQEANELLTTLATEDGLTGLKNRRVFQERLDQEVQRSIRYGLPLSLMLLDVDHFKQYNDRFGHPAGDEVLKTVGEILMQSARATDLVARYGGEEFAVIMINTDQENSTVLAERVRQSIEQMKWDLRQITASIGVATLGLEVAAPLEFVRAADAALYQAKHQGRNVVVCHHELNGIRQETHPLTAPVDSLPQRSS